MAMIVKDWLWRQVWKNESKAEIYSHVCDDYNVDELDPQAIFMFQAEDSPVTMYHFIAHMVNMRNALPCERYRLHRQWVLNEQRRHVPTFKELLIALISGWLHSWLERWLERRERHKARSRKD